MQPNLPRRSSPRAWVVAVSMGYGHQRTAYPLAGLAPGETFINANDYADIPERDRRLWETSRRFYEMVSNFEGIPLIGKVAFRVFDRFQRVLAFYPQRNLAKPTFALRRTYSLIQGGWGEHLIQKLKAQPLPFVSTFFTPAFMAEYFGYPGEIFCVVADADIARTWAPLRAAESRICYLAPTSRAAERLKTYGVRKENIFLTGYPLPLENIGSIRGEVARRDLKFRLLNLDPENAYFSRYAPLIRSYLGPLPKKSDHPLTLLFSIGGAGAQKEIASEVMHSLADKIRLEEIRLRLAVGIKKEVKNFLWGEMTKLGLERFLNTSLEFIWDVHLQNYFSRFNQALRTTDILWTKPSELSFYSALGLPIIIAPPIGSHEEFNRDWLLAMGAGRNQDDPRYASEWLFDLVRAGWLAEAAMQGYVEGERSGAFRIREIVKTSFFNRFPARRSIGAGGARRK